ncbi:FHA domain-containing protein [Salinibacterium hongtaonis]|uniref:FHA domain-containing protein n=1 Tax=Homoserinimonas hongtaonis TaxID=2079791 RepID=A0A2U1SXH7_9MICO|nr:FHA domain-containing protein [Salinibacterium hongtaonis]PWB96243.1 FHA domain-containing protein [Salinibacterium hongtaonis]
MERDAEDTILRSPRPIAPLPELDDADTIIRERTASELIGPPPVAAPAPSFSPPVSAPSHYRFVVNTHEAIGLDRPARIGRKPVQPRILPEIRARLVRVPSPLNEVSSTHIEMRQNGTTVVVTDLMSTNGTTVIVPGSAPRRLRPGETFVISPGTVIDIGDGNRIELLPLQRPGVASATPDARLKQ